MPDASNVYQKIIGRLSCSRRALLVAHQKPDGDTLGAVLACSHFLNQQRIDHEVFCATEPGTAYSFLPGIGKIQTDPAVFRKKPFDTFAIFDSGDLAYCGIESHLKALPYTPFILNIDHHSTNAYYGNFNLVETDASSTTDILYRLFEANRVRIDRKIATCLLCGMLTDTGGFSNLATTPLVLQHAAELLLNGAKTKDIIRSLFTNPSIGHLRLWGRTLSRLTRNEKTGIVSTMILQQDLEECRVDNEAAEGIANFLNNLKGAKAILVLKEEKEGRIKASLRTTHDEMDVSMFAKLLGGGGHRKAAGFTITGKIISTVSGWKIIPQKDH